jgi:hypothetical protein
MKTFHVTIKTAFGRIEYPAIAAAAIDLYPAAYERFGACGVSVKPRFPDTVAPQ